MTRTFSVMGLGKLGASMAAAIASRGFEVIGVDVNRRAVDLVNEGRAPVQETGLDDLVAANRSRLRATLDQRQAVLESDLSFVVVPTPSNEIGAFSLEYAAWAFRELGQALAEKHDYHTVVLTSTVLPGSTRHGLLPILEEASGKRCGPDFGLCYNPEFIALGSVIRDFLHPDFILIGEYDRAAGDHLESCYRAVLPGDVPCRRMSLENAELAKLAVNTFVTTKITFANMLADLCERIPGGDVDVVSDALGLDRRIGRAYLTGGLGYGGPCFPRDNLALGYIARALGTRAELAEATDRANRSLVAKIVRQLVGSIDINQGTTVSVLGLAYKPRSHVIEESQSVALARAIAELGARVVTYDPLAGDLARAEFKDRVLVLDSLESCLSQADVVLVTTPDPLFADLRPEQLPLGERRVTVVDFWRCLDRVALENAGIRYLALGHSAGDEDNARRLASIWKPGGERES